MPPSGTVNWKLWALASPSVHLLFLLVCVVLVYCDLWPSIHHKKIKKLSPGARRKIEQVVEQNWEELLACVKDLIHARLEDGELQKELQSSHTSNLSFLLHGQNFWRIKFTPKNANFSR